jgi:hypothetical protein
MITGFSGVAALSCCRGYGLGPLESEKFVPNAWGETLWRTGGIGFVHYRSGCAPWVWGITLGNAPSSAGGKNFICASMNASTGACNSQRRKWWRCRDLNPGARCRGNCAKAAIPPDRVRPQPGTESAAIVVGGKAHFQWVSCKSGFKARDGLSLGGQRDSLGHARVGTELPRKRRIGGREHRRDRREHHDDEVGLVSKMVR